MPSNPKYLTQSKWQRFAKVSAAILGGFLLAASFHMAIAVFLPEEKNLLATFSFSLFLLWCTLMCVAFLFKNGWKCWGVYGGISLLCGLVVYFKAIAA